MILCFDCPPGPILLMGGTGYLATGRSLSPKPPMNVFTLLVITNGVLFIRELDRNWEVPAGHYVLMRPDLPHGGWRPCQAETRLYWFHFHLPGRWEERENVMGAPGTTTYSKPPKDIPLRFENELLQEMLQPYELRLYKYAPCPSVQGIETLCKQILDSETFANPLRNRRQILFDTLMQLLFIEKPALTRMEEVSSLAVEFIRNHYAENISSSHIAEALNFHPVYLARCIKEIHGCSLMSYLNQYRIETAKRCLLVSDSTVQSIAIQVGFQNVNYFSTIFKKHVGVSPIDYRKSLRF